MTFDTISDKINKGNSLIGVTFLMSSEMTIKSRTVYNLIDFFSEISGFADILFVAAGIFFTFFYSPRILEARLLEHVGHCELPAAKP